MTQSVPASFPKSVRIRKRPEYLRLASVRDKSPVRGFLVVWCDTGQPAPRLGITASRKVGCAVVRNRVKRLVREFFRQNRSVLSPVDINVIARLESAHMTYADVVRELTKAFRLIGMSQCSKAVCSM